MGHAHILVLVFYVVTKCQINSLFSILFIFTLFIFHTFLERICHNIESSRLSLFLIIFVIIIAMCIIILNWVRWHDKRMNIRMISFSTRILWCIHCEGQLGISTIVALYINKYVPALIYKKNCEISNFYVLFSLINF